MMAASCLPVVYRSLEQVVKVLSSPEVSNKIPAAKQLLNIGKWNNLLDEHYGVVKTCPKYVVETQKQVKMPFIVVEGLDGSGKSVVSKGLSEKLNLLLMKTPPNFICGLKSSFDSCPEYVRRAYYSFGNYVAAHEVLHYSYSQGVVMDRYWSSTAAYAVAQKMVDEGLNEVPQDLLRWPDDLLQPDLIVFLVVSEEVRKARHSYRGTTNTKEEQSIATNPVFRDNLKQCFAEIKGSKVIQVEAGDNMPVMEDNIRAIIKKAYAKVVENINFPPSLMSSKNGRLSI